MKAKKARIGRPPKGPAVLELRLEIRISPEERRLYDAAAAAAGQERSDWIRDTLGEAAERLLKQ